MDISNVPDYFIFELSKHMPQSEIAKKFNTTVENIQNIISRYTELAAIFSDMKESLDRQTKMDILKNISNIG